METATMRSSHHSATSGQTLLVPLDGSSVAETILPAAVMLARRLPARITLLHTIERDAPEQVHGERHLTAEAEAEQYLAAVATRLAAEGIVVDWHVHVVPVGNVPRSIATHATVDGAELILLTTHAASDPRSWLIGAVAQGVIRYAAPPVLLLRAGARNQPAPFAPAEVIVAMDRERQGEAAIPEALRLARALGIPLRLLAVVPTVDTIPGDQAAAARLIPTGAAAALDLEAAETAAELNTWAGRILQANPDVRVVVEVARGDPAQIVIAAARARPSILALATHGRSGLTALWSASVGSKVIARGSGPFLLVHPEPPNATKEG
jgi:nucleotide-binding universal stress UspA family protein